MDQMKKKDSCMLMLQEIKVLKKMKMGELNTRSYQCERQNIFKV